MSMLDQTDEWTDQSLRYITAALNSEHNNKKGVEIGEVLKKMLPDNFSPKRILDVGCGNGLFLEGLVNSFAADEGIGIEPSSEGVQLLNNKNTNKRISFIPGCAHNISFENETFELVTIWSVLHWIDRNKYLQSLGELIRVTSKYLVVMDFLPSKEYKVKYSHKKGFFTYKQNFELTLLSSGILNKIGEISWANEDITKPVNKSYFIPFEGNKANWDARKLVIFEKDKDKLPTYDQSYFSKI